MAQEVDYADPCAKIETSLQCAKEWPENRKSVNHKGHLRWWEGFVDENVHVDEKIYVDKKAYVGSEV